MIVYNKNTGEIIAKIPNDQDINVTYKNYSNEFRQSLGMLDVEVSDISRYKVESGELVKYSDDEIMELKMYGKILTEEERINIMLQPTSDEINKAETTVEILTTLQEVGLV